MTAQSREILYFEGEEWSMAAEPLNSYLEKNNIKLKAPTTACWRGYYGSWTMIGKKLYLTDLLAYIEDYKEVGFDDLFPNEERVFAEWFSGQIRLEIGKMLEYIHAGYASIYEREIILEFKKGVLIDRYEKDNTGYIPTVFGEEPTWNKRSSWWKRLLRIQKKS